MVYSTLQYFSVSHYKFKSCGVRPKVIPAGGYSHRKLFPQKALGGGLTHHSKWSGGANCASLCRGGGNQVTAADLGEKSLLAPKLARGLSEHMSKAYKPGTSAISLEKSHTNDLMQRGEGWYFARRSRLRLKLLFPRCFPELLSLIKTKLIVSFSYTLESFGYIFPFPCLAKDRTAKAKMLSKSLGFFPEKLSHYYGLSQSYKQLNRIKQLRERWWLRQRHWSWTFFL